MIGQVTVSQVTVSQVAVGQFAVFRRAAGQRLPEADELLLVPEPGAQRDRLARPLGKVVRALDFGVLTQLGPVCLRLPHRNGARIGTEEHLQQVDVADLRQVIARAGGKPGGERGSASLGDPVQLAPATALLLGLGQVARRRQPLGLGVQLRVLKRPQVPDALGAQRLQLVRGRLAAFGEHAEDDVGGRGQPDARPSVTRQWSIPDGKLRTVP